MPGLKTENKTSMAWWWYLSHTNEWREERRLVEPCGIGTSMRWGKGKRRQKEGEDKGAIREGGGSVMDSAGENWKKKEWAALSNPVKMSPLGQRSHWWPWWEELQKWGVGKGEGWGVIEGWGSRDSESKSFLTFLNPIGTYMNTKALSELNVHPWRYFSVCEAVSSSFLVQS